MSNLVLNAAFARMCNAGLANACKDDVVTVAVGMWHFGQLPETKGLSGEALKVGAFVLDRLSRFACVSLEFKNKVFKFLDELASKVEKFVSLAATHVKMDKLAEKWGVSTDLREFMRELLPLQTRHAFA